MDLNPVNARILVYNITVTLLAKRLNIAPDQVDISRTFSGDPPDGYGMNSGGFAEFCEDAAAAIGTASGRTLDLDDEDWQGDHLDEKIVTFINHVAVMLPAAPPSSTGTASVGWAKS